MKDVLFYLLVYKIWNTEFHLQHETLVAVALTLWIVINIYEIIDALNNK
jgi:hypothetical protein